MTEFPAGSHVMVSFGTYRHHGIARGEGSVVHFGRGAFDAQNAIVEEVSWVVFCQGKPIKRIDSKAEFSLSQIVVRARSRIGERDYDLFDNNCEHFANWCRSGNSESQQINMSETVVRQAVAAGAKTWVGKRALTAAAKTATARFTGVVSTCLARGPIVVAGVADAVQATAEMVASQQGKTKQESLRIGRRVGIVTSVGIGWVVGGPVTAAAGVGIWAVGQVAGTQAVESGKLVVGLALNGTGRTAKQPEGERQPG